MKFQNLLAIGYLLIGAAVGAPTTDSNALVAEDISSLSKRAGCHKKSEMNVSEFESNCLLMFCR